jgi:hypothetical protein
VPSWQYLWRPAPDDGHTRGGHAAFAARARSEVPRQLAGLGADEAWLHATEEPPPRLSLVPFRRSPLALVSVRGETETLGTRAGERLQALGGDWSGYEVNEAQPVARPRPATPGERWPGACLLTVFRRHPRGSRERFLAEWHGKHTPMSLRIHPLRSYVRNTIRKPVLPGSPPWDGIVTESFDPRQDLLNPLRLFGGPLRAPVNMIRVGLHIRSFMDLRSMENYLVSEQAIVTKP